MANNTRDIIDSQNAGTRAILDYLCQEKISDLQNENQALRLAASQQAQNNFITANQIAIAAGGTAGPISLAIAINGEGVASTTMISTPAAVGDYNNVASSIFIDVPRGCCFEIAVKNVSTQTIDVQNANLIIERVA